MVELWAFGMIRRLNMQRIISDGDSMTLLVQILEGHQSIIEALMLIFTNLNRSYPIRGLDDNILGVSYWTGSKG